MSRAKTIAFTAAVLAAVNNHFSKDGKKKTAVTALSKAQDAFEKETMQQINSLEEDLHIKQIEREEIQVTLNPSRSVRMKAEKKLKEAQQSLNNQFSELEEQLAIEAANAAIAGKPCSAYFRQLARLKAKDLTLAPIVPFAKAVETAQSELETLGKDSRIIVIDAAIEKLETQITDLRNLLS